MGRYLDIARKFDTKSQEREKPTRIYQQPMADKIRAFLPRPLGQEDASDPFIAWEGLFTWLIEHSPNHFTTICNAEEAIRTLEAQGMTNGTGYEAACQELLRHFEEARRLKLSHGFKLWTQ